MINRLSATPVVTRTLLLANIALYLLTLILSNSGIALEVILGSFYPESLNFKWWQPFTHLFIHGGTAHIAFNMFALYMFGSTVEDTIGPKRFLILYFLAGLGAFVLFNAQTAYYVSALKTAVSGFGLDPALLQEAMRLNSAGVPATPRVPNIPEVVELAQYYIRPMVGASGAIYGLLVAYGLLYPNAKLVFMLIPVPIKAKFFIPGLILLEIVLGLFNFSWNPVAHFAHLGGAIVGFILVQYWLKKYRQPHA
ncbi:MAG: rhomboid family intramembrane serine protease [Neisseriaceae bacterium]|nr:rhomboid family intramembrane serine protease [Neisseriaceae bacterium]MBP6862127.1 rhomboid family intramembrane serine protease [Neisseriaceae bacterium]